MFYDIYMFWPSFQESMANKQREKTTSPSFRLVAFQVYSEKNGMLIWQEVTWALQPGFCPLFGEVRTRLTWLNEDKRTSGWRDEEKGKARGSQTEPEGKDGTGLRLSVMGFLQSSLKRHEDLNTIYFVLSIHTLLPRTQVPVTQYVHVTEQNQVCLWVPEYRTQFLSKEI